MWASAGKPEIMKIPRCWVTPKIVHIKAMQKKLQLCLKDLKK